MGTFFKAVSEPAGSDLTMAIARHRAFPAICALWFAALFGIGMLVLPISVVEGLTAATGLPAIVPQAAPPLGTTARMLMAMLAAGGGLVIGLLLARRIAAKMSGAAKRGRASGDTFGPVRDKRSGRNDSQGGPGLRKPISAREELGTLSLDDPVDGDPFIRPIGERPAKSILDEMDHRADDRADDGADAEADDGAEDGADVELSDPVFLAREAGTAVMSASVPDEPATSSNTAESEQEAEPEPAIHREEVGEAAPVAADIDGDLARLTLAQLIERFSRAMEQRVLRQQAEAQAAAALAEETLAAPNRADPRPSFGLGIADEPSRPRYNPFSEYGDIDESEAPFASLHASNDIRTPEAPADRAAPQAAVQADTRPPSEMRAELRAEPRADLAMFPARPAPSERNPFLAEQGEDSLREALRKLQTLSKSA